METETTSRAMMVDTWPITRIRPYEMNARKIPRSAVDKVAASLKEYGWQQEGVFARRDQAKANGGGAARAEAQP